MAQFEDIIFDSNKWNAVSAHDAKTGSLLWKFEPGITRSRIKMACCDIAPSIAVYAGKVVLATLDQRLMALEIDTGQKIWDVAICDVKSGGGTENLINQTPNMCIVDRGICSCSKNSHVDAYNINSGVRMWRFYSGQAGSTDEIVEDVVARPASTWKGAWWMHGVNGAERDSMAFDSSQNLLYIYRHGFSLKRTASAMIADSDL